LGAKRVLLDLHVEYFGFKTLGDAEIAALTVRAIENEAKFRLKMLATGIAFSTQGNGFYNQLGIMGRCLFFTDIEGELEGVSLDT